MKFLGALLLGLLMFAVITPHLRRLIQRRDGCTVRTTGTIVEWAPAENERRLEAVVTFDLNGHAYREVRPLDG